MGTSHMSCLGPYKQILMEQDLDRKREKHHHSIQIGVMWVVFVFDGSIIELAS